MSPRQILLALALTAATAFQSPPTRLGAVERCAPRSARGRILDELAGLDETSDDAPALAAPDLSAAPAKQVLEAETLFFEGPPSATELIVPGIAILTVIGIIPFAAALARQFWVKYKITSRRISVQSGLGGNDFTELIYQDIAGLKYVYRGSNEVGDMVIELRDGAKLEMRHVPKFQEIYKYIFERCTPEAQESSFAME
mmetsp:Transcript_31504/g.97244  ORF Transcript_31504/g.97244 Transcript_31504/m.97244 type:complete len:199 (+) Transcript_31504:140-736(+)